MKYQPKTQVVDAFVIVEVGHVRPDDSRMLMLDGHNPVLLESAMLRHYVARYRSPSGLPSVGDYVVEADGFTDIYPPAEFARKYGPVKK